MWLWTHPKGVLQEGNLNAATAEFRKTLELKGDFAEAHNNLGLALLQKGQVDSAIACFQKALAIKPGDATTRKNIEKALIRKQRTDQTTVH